MKTTTTSLSVSEVADTLTQLIRNNGFTLFCDIDHQANAQAVDLDMPASRVLIFGNPVAGTKLMQQDITISLDLPLRIAIVSNNGQTQLLHPSRDDYCRDYDVAEHPVLTKIEHAYAALISDVVC